MGELRIPHAQYVRISTDFFMKILEADKVLYNSKMLFSVSGSESHTPTDSKPSQCEGGGLSRLCHGLLLMVFPQGMGLVAVTPCEEPG